MKRKMVAVLMATAMMVSTGVPVFAADTTQDVTTNTTAEATVTYLQDSAFTVTVPKTVALGADKTKAYAVHVDGDIAGDEKVDVTPDATFEMAETGGKDNVTATVTQDVKSWTYDKLGSAVTNDATGSISATDLTAGDWTGTLNFEIALNTVE